MVDSFLVFFKILLEQIEDNFHTYYMLLLYSDHSHYHHIDLSKYQGLAYFNNNNTILLIGQIPSKMERGEGIKKNISHCSQYSISNILDKSF
jgi:hypothetical protein